MCECVCVVSEFGDLDDTIGDSSNLLIFNEYRQLSKIVYKSSQQ